MTLATRCIACGTAFRVVQDQLKVANGWVRCGRCAHVFDASDALFAPDAVAGPATQAQGSAPMDTSVVSAAVSAEDAASISVVDPVEPLAPISTVLADTQAVDAPAAKAKAEAAPPPDVPPEPPRWLLASSVEAAPVVVDIGIGSVAPPDAPVADRAPSADVPTDEEADTDTGDGAPPDFVDARFNEDLLAGLPGLRDPDEGDGVAELSAAGLGAGDGTASPPLAAAPTAHPIGTDVGHPNTGLGAPSQLPDPVSTPESGVADTRADTAVVESEVTPVFMRRRIRNDRRWQRGPVRAALGAGAALLLLLLGLQASLHWRDWLATRWPASAPWLSAVCVHAGCRVQPLRRIEDLGVDSTSLIPVSPDSTALRLAVVLSNRGDLPLAAPTVELTLTNATGELVARKVLTPADFHSAVALLQPGATVRWQTVLLAAGEHVAGYTVELFYP